MKHLYFVFVSVLAVGCKSNRPIQAEAPKEDKLSVTDWTDKTELFMEYPPLVAGEKGRYAVHFTQLSDFRPVSSGQVEILLRAKDGTTETFRTEAPSKPGIFGIDVLPKNPGMVTMTVALTGKSLRDVHRLGEVQVFAAKNAVTHTAEEPTEETIAFLKEQQWALDFGTEVVTERTEKDSLRVPAEVTPRSGGEAVISAPFTGRLTGSRVPALGTRVEPGQELLGIVPPTNAPADLPALQLGKVEAETALRLAERDLARAERLLAAGAIPSKRVDEAKAAESNARARVTAAQARLEQYEATRNARGTAEDSRIFSVRAPMAGIVAEVSATPGANVEAGQSLFKIIDVDTVYVAAHVPEASIPRLRELSGAELEITEGSKPQPVQRLISKGQVVDPASRTVSVLYEVTNERRLLAVGQAVSLRLFTAKQETAPAVPETAIVDDGGRPVVFVQKQGEAFARRPVKLGNRASNYVQVLEGVRPGERVVSRGGYLIRLATMSSQIPAHGHVH